MMAHRKYACHRVYDRCNHYHPQSVVSLTEKGEFIGCDPLVHETSFTQWIGGVIVLSPKKELTLPTDFDHLRQDATKGNEKSPLYAWHVSDFNFQEEALTSQSIIRRLPFSV